MTMQYVRDTYGVPAKRGARVQVYTKDGQVLRGTITRATHYVYVRIDGERYGWPYHPTELLYITQPALAAALGEEG
jgi:hypothetical protein